MTLSFRLPDLGEGVHEAEILALPVTNGQAVREGDIIMEIETDKAAVEIPSPYTGTVSEIMVKVGDMAVVGDVLMTFTADAGENPAPTEETAIDVKAQGKRVRRIRKKSDARFPPRPPPDDWPGSWKSICIKSTQPVRAVL